MNDQTRCVSPSFGRIWDFHAACVERFVPSAAPILRQARLFCFPHNPADVLPKSVDPKRCDFWRENFMLPYPITAIEDKAGMVIMWDSPLFASENWRATFTKASQSSELKNLHPIVVPTEPSKGMFERRFFLDVIPTWAIREGSAKRWDSDAYYPEEDAVMVTFGVCLPDLVAPSKWNMTGEALGYWCLSKKGLLWDSRNKELSRLLPQAVDPALQNAKCFMEEVMWFNDPDRFVVEERGPQAVETRPKNRKGKIRSAEERPVYHSWTPLDIRRLREPGASKDDGTESKKRGHWRRGHFRTLKADRYARSGMQGKTVLVRPTFVGEETFYVERSHYRILLGENEVLVGDKQ